MKLIDADALQRRICGAKCGCEYEDCGNEGDCGYDHFISNAPTINAVPVVRCRECKHRGTDYCIFHIKGEPADEELLLKLDNDFCSYGERKGCADNG